MKKIFKANFKRDESHASHAAHTSHLKYLALFLLPLAVFGQTNRLTKATVHEVPSNEFLLAYLARQYTNDMRTIHGRIKWHGKPIAQEIDTNRWCKIERYADGTIHLQPFRPQLQNLASITNSESWRVKAAKLKAAIAARRAQIEAGKSAVPGLKDAQLKAFDAKHSPSNVTVNVEIR